jgi:hydrogenase maturation factor HypF (carbamoyltransferase family)
MEIIHIDVGNKVFCDMCDTEYTNNENSKGGFLFSGKAVCPKCAPHMMQSIKRYNEERFIKATANKDETFRDFVYRIRNIPGVNS